MLRLRQVFLPLLAAAILAFAPGRAAAVPVALDREFTLAWASPVAEPMRFTLRLPQRAAPLARARLLAIEITLLPSGRIVARSVIGLPPGWTAAPRPVAPALVALPLPGAMPLFLGALAGLLILGRRRRGRVALAGPDRST
jgi:hypothetical protein